MERRVLLSVVPNVLDLMSGSTGSISGTLFNDQNANGNPDSSEPKVAGRSVYIDANNNGKLDSGERNILTDVSGRFAFSGLSAGRYVIREVLPTGWRQTAPNGTAGRIVDLSAGQNVTVMQIGATHATVITGRFYNDVNANGVLDANEPGLANWQAFVDKNNNSLWDKGEVISTADSKGNYTLVLSGGTYRIREVSHNGWTLTQPAGSAASRYYDVTLAAGQLVTARNFGNALSQIGSITGSVFNDHNINGIKDGVDAFIAGRTVFIDANLNGTQDAGETSTVTDANGNFWFTGLQAATYRIIAVNPANWATTIPAAGYRDVTVAAGQTISGGSFGSVHLATITGTFWNDANHNGLQDSGEVGLSGQTLFLDANNNGVLEAGETAVVTDASGNFGFTGLLPITVHVRAVIPSGFKPTAPSTAEKDFALFSGQLSSGNLFGAVLTGTISGVVYNDPNANGTQDSGEAGVSGRTVFIDSNKNGVFNSGEPSVLTGADGSFTFSNLFPATYNIGQIVPTGSHATVPATAITIATIIAGQALTGVKFGVAQNAAANASITGTVFADANHNGLFDAGEKGLPGWTVYIDSNNNGVLDAGEPTLISGKDTGSLGKYMFGGLAAGTYSIRVISQAEFTQTIPASNGPRIFTLAAGQAATGGTFGELAAAPTMGSISGTIYDDANGNGALDAGEIGLAAWQVYVDNNCNGVWDATEQMATADSNGLYNLTLPAGIYQIREVRQEPWTRTQPAGVWPLGYYDVTLGAAQVVGGCNFGNQLPITAIPQLGGGLNNPSDRIQDHPFVDLVKTTRGFYNLAGRLASNGMIDFSTTDPDGWPTEDFSFSAADNSEWGVSLDTGVYHVSFVGPVGTLVSIRTDAPNPAALVPAGTPVPTLSQIGFDEGTNTFTYDVTVPQGALVLAFDFQNTQGQVRDIRVLQPGYDLSDCPTFREEYLNFLKTLSPGVIRLMDWTKTNDNPEVNWSDRPLVTDATQARARAPGDLQPLKGVAWEYGIQLANTLNADIWVNIPARATDDYVTQLASLLRQTLNPQLKIYIEYSNEVWNSGFEQYSYNKNAAGAEVVAAALAGTSSDLNYDHLSVDTTKADGGGNVVTWADRRCARRLKEISDIFKNVWTAAGLASPINGQVRAILCSQFANMSRFDNMLKFVSAVYGAPANYFYGIGIAPYLDLDGVANKSGLTADEVLSALQTDANSYLTNGAFDGAKRRASQWGLALEAYEGGLDTYGTNAIAAKAAASLDPRMQDILTGFLETWFAKGGDLFNYYTLGARSFNSPYGTYSITDDIRNLNEPKELAFEKVRDQLSR